MGLAPSEFWDMKPKHFWLLLAKRIDDQKTAERGGGRLSDEDKDELLQLLRNDPNGD